MNRTAPPAPARRSLLRRAALLATAVALLAPAAAGDEGGTPGDSARRLSDARYLEMTQGRPADALALYQQVLTAPDLPPAVRGDALLGAARCELALGHADAAAAYWDRILADPSLPAEVRDRADRERLERLSRRTEVDKQRAEEEAMARALEEQRRAARERALRKVEEARAAMAQGRLEAARELALEAQASDPKNPEAESLLQEIAAKLPDRMELVNTLIQFFYSSRIEGFQRLRERVEGLEREGRALFGQREYEQADASFRGAVERIDQSDFLSEMADDRARLVIWLRRTRDAARGAGLALPPEPPLPDPAALTTGYQGQFFQLLARIFTAHDQQGDPLAIYEAAPAPQPGLAVDRSLGPTTFGAAADITPSRSRGSLTRARWAERWIRENVSPGTWPAPGGAPGDRPAGSARRLLLRYGDLLVVQHTRSTQQRVGDLLATFPDHPAPMQVDVAVFAGSEGGTVRAADRLRARAVPQESGVDLVVSGALVEECTRDLVALEAKHLTLLGTARLVLKGETSARIDLTQLTERHPLHQGLKPPPLKVPDADARYGLSLEVYAEDLSRAAGGAPSAAVSVRAVSRWPVPSVVVPKTTQAVDWTRLPKFAEQVVESDRRVPHFGTLLLLGVANPFSPGAATETDLVVLVGVRPASAAGGPAPVPDAPRVPGGGSPDGAVDRGHLVGPLATEVVDDVVMEGWPRRPATLPVPSHVAAEDRAAFLGQWLAEQAGLWKPGGADPSPVSLRDGYAYARLPPEPQERLAAAVLRLAAQETALYEVDVVGTEVPQVQAQAWAALPGVQRLGEGRFLLPASAAEQVDVTVRAGEDTGSPFACRATLLARATQKVAVRQIRSRTIVEDLRPRRDAGGATRYVPLSGSAEEGLIVEVRPDVEDGSRRIVRLRARAARLSGLESVPLAGTETLGTAPHVQVPRWLPVRDLSAAAPLADGEALLLVALTPDESGHVVAVKVTTRRLP